MTYTIPSQTVRPGSAYQPKGIAPAYVRQNARALYLAKGGAYSSTRLLDQSPLNSGTRRPGSSGGGVKGDGTDDEIIFGDFGTAIWFSGWVRLDSDNQCLFSLSNSTATALSVAAGVLTAGATLTLTGIKIDNVSKTASEAGALLNDNAWHFLSCGIGDGLGGASTADDVRYFTDGTAHGDVSAFDWRFYSTVPTAAELTESYSGESPNRNAAALSKYAAWTPLEEQDGTTAYDISGNGITGTLTNMTLANARITHNLFSFANQVGYNLSGSVYIPRDESDPSNDVLGNPLTYTGRRPNDGALINSNCLTADGTLYIAAAHLTGSETVVSSDGTSTPSISAGRIDFTAGTCWNLLLSDGTHYKLADGYGTIIADSSGDKNHGTLANATLASAWGATQNDYHSNLLDGCGKRMWFDGDDDDVEVPALGNVVTSTRTPFNVSFNIISNNNLGTGDGVLSQGSSNSNTPVLAITNGLLSAKKLRIFYRSDDNTNVVDGVEFSQDVFDGQRHEVSIVSNGSLITVTVDGVEDSTAITDNKQITLNRFSLMALSRSTKNFYMSGSVWDLNYSLNGVIKFTYQGYGNTNEDWIDTSGNGNNGTVVGSPEPYYIPAAQNGLDAFGQPLTDPFVDGKRNRAETGFDYDPDSTPEMGSDQLGIPVPSAHAFGDAYAASTQIFSRQRTETEDRTVVMPEAQTGDALTTLQNYTAS